MYFVWDLNLFCSVWHVRQKLDRLGNFDKDMINPVYPTYPLSPKLYYISSG